MQRQKKLEHVKELIKDAYVLNGLTDKNLADIYNCSEGTIRRILLSQGVVRRGPGRRKGVKNPEKEVRPNGVQQ